VVKKILMRLCRAKKSAINFFASSFCQTLRVSSNKRFAQLLQIFDNFFARSQDVSGMKNQIALLTALLLRLPTVHAIR